MTGVSAVYSVPEPDDMKPIAGSTDLKSTSVGSIEDLTAFYKEFMTGHGWTFDAAYSVTDPGLAEGKKLGHITDAVYCKDSTGVPGVSIIVGYLNDKPGKALSLAIIDDSGEDSCP